MTTGTTIILGDNEPRRRWTNGRTVSAWTHLANSFIPATTTSSQETFKRSPTAFIPHLKPIFIQFNDLNGVEPYSSQTTNDAGDVGGTSSHGLHLPEPPASPSDDASSLSLVKADAGTVKTPSANRLSISYFHGNRRFDWRRARLAQEYV